MFIVRLSVCPSVSLNSAADADVLPLVDLGMFVSFVISWYKIADVVLKTSFNGQHVVAHFDVM